MKKWLVFITVLGSLNISAQERIIKGVVKNAATNEPVSGATIKVNNGGVITNKNGMFNLATSDSASKIYISSAGFQSDSLSLLPSTSEYTIYLKQAFNNLEEVVVSGTMKA